MELKEIEIDLIKPDPKQPRKTFENIEKLTQTIKEKGIIQPIIIRKAEKFYYIVDGERRWRAAKKAGLKTIPCLIRPEPFTEEDILEMQIIVSLQADKIHEEEIAPQVIKLMKLKNWSARIAAIHLGLHFTTIQSYKELAETTDDEKEAIKDYRESEEDEEIEETENKETKEKIYICKKCNKEFKTKIELNKHLRDKHKKKGLAPSNLAEIKQRVDKKYQQKLIKLVSKFGWGRNPIRRIITILDSDLEDNYKQKLLNNKLSIKECESLIKDKEIEERPEPIQFERTANNVIDDILSNLHDFKFHIDELKKDNINDIFKSKVDKAITTAGLHLKSFKEFVNILRQRGAKPDKYILALIKANGKI